jgi:hypothetical protein
VLNNHDTHKFTIGPGNANRNTIAPTTHADPRRIGIQVIAASAIAMLATVVQIASEQLHPISVR